MKKKIEKSNLWKAYFWFYLVVFYISEPQIASSVWEAVNSLIKLVILVAMYGFCWKKEILSKIFWKAFFFVNVFWVFIYTFVISDGEFSSRNLDITLELVLFVTGFMILSYVISLVLFIIPPFLILYSYAFNNGEMISLKRNKK